MRKIENILIATKYLKSGLILFSNNENNTTYYKYKDDLIHIIGDNSSFFLNEFEFMSLYENTTFYLKEDESGDEINTEKDNEYYNYGALKH